MSECGGRVYARLMERHTNRVLTGWCSVHIVVEGGEGGMYQDLDQTYFHGVRLFIYIGGNQKIICLNARPCISLPPLAAGWQNETEELGGFPG